MVAIVSGNHLGLNLGSLGVLGKTEGGAAGQGSSGERVYVNVATGNLVVQDADEQLMGRGGAYASLRTYNSQGRWVDRGLNWSINGAQRMIRLSGPWGQAGSSMVRAERDGAQASYAWDEQRQAYVSLEGGGAYRTLVRDGEAYVWHDGAGTQERYGADGRLHSRHDAQGRTTEYRYDNGGRLSSVLLPTGEQTHYVYDGENLAQVQVETADGRRSTRTRYRYDEQRRLTEVIVDLSPEDNDIADGRVYVTRYTYDGDSERLASISQDDGSRLHLTYVQDGDAYRIATVTDALGHTTRYAYQAGQTIVTDAIGLSTRYRYDASGQLTEVAGATSTVRYAYNERGDVVSITDGAGRMTRMRYDANGNQIAQEDAQGNLITRRYDDHNRMIAESVSRSGENIPPRTTHYIYGAGQQLRFTVSAEGRVTEYRYNAQGDQSTLLRYTQEGAAGRFSTTQTTPNEATLAAWVKTQPAQSAERRDMDYDARGQLTRQTTYADLDAQGQGITGSASVQHYVYDQWGRLLKTINGHGGITTYGYDGLGREIVRNEQGKSTQTRYDAAGRTSSTIEANGLTTQRSYDAAGRLLSVAQAGAGQDLGTTRHTYDALGRRVMSQDPLGGRSYVFYDAAGNKAGELDAAGLLTEYRYNGAGQLTRSLAYATRISPDQLPPAGLPALAALRPARSEQDRLAWRSYDAAGRLSQDINAHGAVTRYQYDAAGKPIRSTQFATLIDISRLGEQVDDNHIKIAASPADRSTRHFYDADGLRIATLDAEGYLTEWTYDSAGRPTQVTRHAQAVAAQSVNSDLAALQAAVKDGARSTERSLYNARGQVAGQIDAQGYLTETLYDAAGNVARHIRYATAAGDGQSLAELRPAPDAQDRSAVFRYDSANRLIEEIDHQGTISRYRYDQTGNLVATTRAAGTPEAASRLAQYDLQGRKTAELSVQGAALLREGMSEEEIGRIWQQHGQRYHHDALGRLTGSTDANGNSTSYVYDAGGRLTHTINALGEVAEVRYDAFGQKAQSTRYTSRLDSRLLAVGITPKPLEAALAALRQDAGNSVTTYRYDSLGLLLEQQDAAGLRTSYFYNSFGETVRQDRIATEPGGPRRTSHATQRDRRGHITHSVQDAGGLHFITTRQLDAYGRVTHTTDARGNTTRTEYDGLGRQIVLTDALGGTVQTSYDAFDRIVRQDEHGKITHYRYDAARRSTSMTTADGVTVTTTFDRHGQRQAITDGRGNVTRFTYDPNGNLIAREQDSQTHTQRYDNANRLIETVDETGRRTVLGYDAVNRVITRTVDPEGLNLTTRTAYDAQGRQVSVTQPGGQVTQFTYDRAGRLITQTVDPDGLKLTTRHDYDVTGNIIRSTQPNGNVTSFTYDNAGRRIEETTDPDGLKLTRRYRYDEAGNLTQSIDANGHATRYVYDAKHRKVWTINPLGAVHKTVYDATTHRIAGQIQYVRSIDLSKLTAAPKLAELDTLLQADAADIGQWTRYDAQGRIHQQADARGAVTSFTYDANGNVMAKTKHATLLTELQRQSLTGGTAIILQAHAEDITERSVYDSRNRLRYGIDALGGVTEQRYDAAGRLTDKIAYAKPIQANTGDDEAAIANKLQAANEDRRTRYVYDTAGRLRYEINAQGGINERKYDANGNLVQQIGYAKPIDTTLLQEPLTEQGIAGALKTDVADRSTTTLYDAANRVQYSVDALGYVTGNSYDKAGNLIKMVRYANAAGVVRDADGKLQLAAINASAQDRTEYRHYDAAGRLRFKVDPLGHVEETRYDAVGRITELVKYREALAASVERGNGRQVEQALGISANKIETVMTPSSSAAPQMPASSAPVEATESTPVAVSTPTDAQLIAAMRPGEEYKLQIHSEAMKLYYQSGGRNYVEVRDYFPCRYNASIRIKGSSKTVVHLEIIDVNGRVIARSESARGNDQWQIVSLSCDPGEKGGAYITRLYVDSAGSRETNDDFVLLSGLSFEHPERKSRNFTCDMSLHMQQQALTGPAYREFVSMEPLRKILQGEEISKPIIKLAGDNFAYPGMPTVVYRDLGTFFPGDVVSVSVRMKSDIAKGWSQVRLGDHEKWTSWPVDTITGDIKKNNGEWQTISFSHTVNRTTKIVLELAGANWLDDIFVRSTQRGKIIDQAEEQTLQWKTTKFWYLKKEQVDPLAWYSLGKVERVQIRLDVPVKMALPAVNPVNLNHLNPTEIAAPTRVESTLPSTSTIVNSVATANAPNSILRYAYDAAGNLLQSTDALGNSETSAYDAHGRRTSFTNALGARRTYAYDANGNLISTTDALGKTESAAYDHFGRKTSVTDKLGAITRYTYDSLGRLTATTDALGNSERMGYDALGNRTSIINKLGCTITYAYDALGRQISETLPVQAAGRNGQPQAIVNRTEYDAFGNRVVTIEAAGLAEERITRYTFDVAGRPLNRISQLTRTYAHGQGWKDASPTETTRYDSFGNLIAKTDANGNATHYYYDAGNRVIGEVGPTGAYTTRQYDAAGNVILQRSYTDPVGLPAGDDLPVMVNDSRYRELRFTYDANGKLLETIQAQVGYAELDKNTGNFLYQTGDIVTRTAYNAMGQAVMNQDAQGHRSYLYYDALGRKILAIDAAGYATAWQYDAGGNVVSQRSYAQVLDKSNPWTESSAAQDLTQRLSPNPRDRIVNFEYDVLGRQTMEIRRNAGNAGVDANGRLNEQAGDAITRSAYNANGDLTAKTDAIGNVTQWEYDQSGRKTATLLPTATDHTGKSIRQTTRYQYNGLGLLTQEVVEGNTTDTARITRHAYDASGRRVSQTLATGDVIRYGYDAQGNTTAEIIDRKQADGSVLHEMTSISYDGANREVRRSSGSADVNNNPTHGNDSATSLAYDAFGKQIGKTTAAGNAQGQAQEFVEYDAAGRIWRSNADRGITKVYFYDRAGRPTLTLQSQALDLRSMTLEQIQQEMGRPDSRIATTITVYDERGQVIRTIQPKMSSSRPHASLMAAQGGGYFQGVQLTSGATLLVGANAAYMQGAPTVADSVGMSGNVQFSVEVERHKWGWRSPSFKGASLNTGVIPHALRVNMPDMNHVFGAHQMVAVINVYKDGSSVNVLGGNTQIFSGAGLKRIDFDATAFMPPSIAPGNPNAARRAGRFDGRIDFSVSLFVKLSNGHQIHLGNVSGGGGGSQPQNIERYPATNSAISHLGFSSTSYFSLNPALSYSNILRLTNQTLHGAAKVDLYYRPQGTGGGARAGFTRLGTSLMPGQSGTYIANMAGLNGNYDMIMVAMDSSGRVIRWDELVVFRGNNSLRRSSGMVNTPIFDGSTMHMAGLQLGNGKFATSLTYKLNNGNVVRLNARDGIPGLFTIPVGTTGASLELNLTAADGSTDTLIGSVHPTIGVCNLKFIKYADSSLVFNNLDQSATRLEIKYRQEGSPDWKTKTLTRSPGSSSWTWDTQVDGLVPDRNQAYRYEVSFDAFDADGIKTNNGTAVVAAGAIAGGTYTTASITGAAKPRWMAFNTGHADAASLSLRYRAKGSTDSYAETTLRRLPSGIFKLDISDLPADTEYEYAWNALDPDGNALVSSRGYFRSESGAQATDGSNINWVINLDNDLNSETQINRSQRYDAFGNIVAETDGNGNTVEFEYNALGQLTIKRDAATDITLENGYVVTGHRAETRYYYDAADNLVGTRDAGGNLTTQRWHFGSERAQVAQSWAADGGTKKNAYDVFGNLRTVTNEDNWQSTYQYDALNRLVTSERSITAATKAVDRYEYDIKGQRIASTNALGYRSTTRYDNQGRVTETTSAEGRSVKYAYTYDATIASIADRATGGWRRVMTDANGRTMTDDLDTTGRVLRHVDLSGRVYSYRYNYAGLISSQRSTAGQHIDYSYYGNSYVKNIHDHGTGKVATYEYDNNGNRSFEGYMADKGQFAFQQQRVTYDAMNRVVRISDPRYDILYEYDALGNRRRMNSTYTDGLGRGLAHQEYWYKYDRLSRFTISMGQLTGGKRATRINDASIGIERGQTGDGVALTYTQAGLRASASYAATNTRGAYSESYYYDGRGLLTQTALNDGSRVLREMDAAGRVTTIKAINLNGSLLQHSQRTWNKDNQLLQDHDVLGNKGTNYELMADGTVSATQTYSGAATSAGQRSFMAVVIPNNSGNKETTLRTTYTYDWWDSAKQTSITLQARNSTVDSWKKVWRPGFSHFSYDVNGHSKLAYDEEGKRAFSYWTDQDGQVLKRQELIGGTYDANTGQMNGASKSREHGYYYLDGKRIGDVGNDQTERTDYAQELAALRNKDNSRSYERFTPTNAADFDANFQPINSDYPANAPSSYTVRQGDTLQSIARGLWGDASLWYLLAEANGLINQQPSAPLAANSTLIVPNQVTNIHNTSSTFKPYNPGKALGDTSPTLPSAPPPPPPPSRGGGCGGIGIIIAVIVIAVAVMTQQYYLANYGTAAGGAAAGGAAGGSAAAGGAAAGGAAAGAVTYTAGSYAIAGAIGGAAGAFAGQVAGNILGVQNGFNWKAVGMGALGGALSGGLNGGWGVNTANATFNASANAAIGNTLSQGAAMVLGWQDRFDWRNVAASAAAAGVGQFARNQGYSPFEQGMARGVAGYAATGGNFSQALPGIVGGAIGDHLVNGVYEAQQKTAMEQKLLAAQRENQELDFQRDVENRRASNPLLQAMAERQSMEAANLAQAQREFLWSSVAGTGTGVNMQEIANSPDQINRDMEMRRLIEQAQEPQYRQSAPFNLGEIRGVGNHFGESAPLLPSSATGLKGWMEGLRGESSVMETESMAKRLGRYTGMAGEVVNQMFNPKEIAHGMWTAIDSGNPIEMGVAAMGFFPMGNIGKVPGAVERGLLGSTRLKTEIARIGQDGHAIARHGGAVTDSQLFTRAMTGVAPDGSFLVKNGSISIPPSSTAFHSNALLAHSDLFVRQNYLEQAIALSRPGAPQVAINGVDVGMVVGRGFERVSSVPGAFGPLRFNDDLSRVTAVYERDAVTGLWRTTTLYPVR